MKKILIFSTSYFPTVGGAEVAVKEVTDRINDIEFDMITLRLDGRKSKKEKIGNVNVYRVGLVTKKIREDNFFSYPWKLNKIFFPIMATCKAISLNRKRSYDLIWAIMANYAGIAALFYKYLAPKKKLLLTIQEGHPVEEYKKMFGPAFFLVKKLFKKANHVQAISNYLAEFSREMGFEGRLSVVPNAVNYEHFAREYKSEEIESIRKRYVKDAEKLLITTSRLAEKNAVDDLIKSLAYLSKNIKLIILGTGPDMDKLKAIVDEKELDDRVYFLGHIDHSEMPKYLKASDVFSRPSLSEGLGNSFLEAMAVGIPVIATPVGGIPDFLVNRKTGLFCEMRNPKDLAGQVETIINDNKLREEIIKNAKKMIKEKYEWSIIASGMREIL